MKVRIKGGPELAKLLDQLPEKLHRNVMRGALRAGCAPIADDAKANAHGQRLKKSIKIGSRTIKGQAVGYVRVTGYWGFLGMFQEFGVRPHIIKVSDEERPTTVSRSGRVKKLSYRTLNRRVHDGSLKVGERFVGPVVMHPGHAARPFMRPALDRKAKEAINAFGEYIRRRLRFGNLQSGGITVDDVEEPA